MPQRHIVHEGSIMSFHVEDHRNLLPCNRIGPDVRGFPRNGRMSMSDSVQAPATPATTCKAKLRDNPASLPINEIGGLNTHLRVLVLDEPMQPNSACHLYVIEANGVPTCTLNFQRGPIKEHGVNGISNEALLAVIAHRFEGFQRGKFACDDNAEALKHIYAAMECMSKRTQGRVLAQVEGYDLPNPGKG